MMTAAILQGLLSFAAFVVAFLVVMRISSRPQPATTAIGLAIAMHPVALALLLAAGRTVNFVVFSISYCFFTLCFLMVLGAVYKSISLRILLDLAGSPQRSAGYDDVLQRYIVAESYLDRLELIRAKRLVSVDGNRLSLGYLGLRIARTVQAIQNLFRIEHSG